jgi:hypothetical protein
MNPSDTKNILELFSGTHSAGKVAAELNYNVISVDICDYKGKYPPTHKTDIMSFDYKQYPRDHFTAVWGSPPCIYYSKLQHSWYGRKKKDGIYTKEKHQAEMVISDAWVKRTLEIIDYFKPKKWVIENPRTGYLKTRDFMQGIPYVDVDYCRYSDWGYKKETRLWTNVEFEGKICNKQCGNMNGKKHKRECSRNNNTLDRYRVPPNLIREILISP